MADSKGRKIYFDFLRIISIILVMFNHTGNKGFIRFTSLENRGGMSYYSDWNMRLFDWPYFLDSFGQRIGRLHIGFYIPTYHIWFCCL